MNNWDISPFMGATQYKTPKTKGWSEGKGRLTLDELDGEKNIAFVPPKGYGIVDADTKIAIANLEHLFNLLNIKPKSYNTTRGKHYVFKLPEGKAFDGIASQNGGTLLIGKESGKSDIDLKCGGRNGKNGYVLIKQNNKWRVEPKVIIGYFEDEDIPTMPYSLLIPRPSRMYLYEYIAGPRDDTFFKWITKLRAKGWVKEDVIRLAVEVKQLAGDKETLSETVDWAERKWEWVNNKKSVIKISLISWIFIKKVVSEYVK